MLVETEMTKVDLPRNTRRVGGLVLSTPARAAAVDRSERARAEMYALMEAHPESAEELLSRVVEMQRRMAEQDDIPRAGSVPPLLTKAPKQMTGLYREGARVASPYAHGHDSVHRVVDPIEYMRRRRQLGPNHGASEHAHRAAIRVRYAYDAIFQSLGGTMDFDRVRGQGTPGQHPHETRLAAADTMLKAWRELYAHHYCIVVMVACEMRSIEETACILHGPNASRDDKKRVGDQLREGLRVLADMWFGPLTPENEMRPETRIYRAPDALSYSAEPGVIDRGRTAHATGRKVFRNK